VITISGDAQTWREDAAAWLRLADSGAVIATEICRRYSQECAAIAEGLDSGAVVAGDYPHVGTYTQTIAAVLRGEVLPLRRQP
jgi:hypothetical protein